MLSVIWLICNRDNIAADLQVLEETLSGRAFELIIVSDGGPDIPWQNEENSSVRVIHHAQPQGMMASFQEGADAAAGETILFLQSNVLLSGKSLARLEACLDDMHASCTAPVSKNSIYSRFRLPIEYFDYTSLQAFVEQTANNPELKPQPALILDSGCFLVRRSELARVNGLDKNFTSSNYGFGEFCLRLWQAGGKAVSAANVYVHDNPLASEKDLDADSEYFHKKHGFHMAYSCSTRPELLQFIDFTQSDFSALEVGCACGGNFCAMLEKQPAAELYGIELNQGSAEIAKRFAQIYALDVENFQKPEWHDKFSAVIMGDLLEHLRDPWQTVQNMYNITRPGGRIIISVPNIMHTSIFYGMLQGKWDYDDSGILDRTHLRFFTRKSALELLTQAGYQIAQISYTNVQANDEIDACKQKLLPLLGSSVAPEELDAYQWVIVGEKV